MKLALVLAFAIAALAVIELAETDFKEQVFEGFVEICVCDLQ